MPTSVHPVYRRVTSKNLKNIKIVLHFYSSNKTNLSHNYRTFTIFLWLRSVNQYVTHKNLTWKADDTCGIEISSKVKSYAVKRKFLFVFTVLILIGILPRVFGSFYTDIKYISFRSIIIFFKNMLLICFLWS